MEEQVHNKNIQYTDICLGHGKWKDQVWLVFTPKIYYKLIYGYYFYFGYKHYITSDLFRNFDQTMLKMMVWSVK